MKIKDIDIEDRLSAISRLFIFSSNKRFGILKNDINLRDKIGNISSLINDEIFKRIEINIFEENNIKNIFIYEQELNQLFINYNTELIDDDELEDEIDLIKSYKEVERDFFSKNGLEINRDIKDKFKELKISSSIIITYALKPNYLHFVEEKEFHNNFFATSIYKNKVILYHLSENKDRKNRIDINTVLVFDAYKYKEMFSNPVRMFLNILDIYGIDITIEGISKRFFKIINVRNDISGGANLIHIGEEDMKDKGSAQFSMIPKQNGAIIREIAFKL